MIIVLHYPKDNTYYVVDQTNYTSGGWSCSIDEALADMNDKLTNDYYTMSLDEYRDKYPDYNAFCLDKTPQPYEYW